MRYITILLLASCLGAQEYHPFKDFSKELKTLAANKIVTLQSMGKSTENRDLYAVTVSKAPLQTQPAILLIGGLDAVDIAGSQVCLYILKELTDVDNLDAQKLLSEVTFYILPRVNPDACEAMWQPVQYERRLNSKQYDLDHDGFISEDGYNDLNKDAMISMLRVFDAAGEYVVDNKEPRLLRKADPLRGEQPIFKLFTEGIDDDQDGFLNEDEPGGVALDKNFTFHYQPHTFSTGPFAVSENETRAIADFCFQHQNIMAVFSFSDNGNMTNIWPAVEEWDGAAPLDKMLQRDADYLNEIAADFVDFTGMNRTSPLPLPQGDLAQWAYFHFGRWSMSVPVWQIPEPKDSTLSADDPLYEQKLLLNWLDEHHPEKFVEWQNIDHPDFPDKQVQVGGFAPFAALPPADSLHVVSERFAAFLFHFAEKMPVLNVHVNTEKLADQVCRVTAVIQNNGYLPTNTALAKQNQWLEKVRIEIELPSSAELASGNALEIIPQIDGGASIEKSWIVTGRLSSEITLKIGSPSCGFIEKHIMR